MTAIQFTIPGPAVGKGRPRAFRMNAGIRMHTPEKTAKYESLVAMVASEAMKINGYSPIKGAVSVDLLVVAQVPASWSQKKQQMAISGDVRPTTKPDADNVLKAVADACNGIVFDDDKQIVDVRVRKFYGTAPRVDVLVRMIEG